LTDIEANEEKASPEAKKPGWQRHSAFSVWENGWRAGIYFGWVLSIDVNGSIDWMSRGFLIGGEEKMPTGQRKWLPTYTYNFHIALYNT
jgi:hypothetical protein